MYFGQLKEDQSIRVIMIYAGNKYGIGKAAAGELSTDLQ